MKNEYDGIIQGLTDAIDFLEGDENKGRRSRIQFDSVKKYKADEIREIRKGLGFSQQVFAHLLGVSKRCVEDWEAGKNVPSGPASRLLELLADEGQADGFIRSHLL